MAERVGEVWGRGQGSGLKGEIETISEEQRRRRPLFLYIFFGCIVHISHVTFPWAAKVNRHSAE